MRKSLFTSLLMIVAASYAAAGIPFERMYVFGDSFSDVGNLPCSSKFSYGGRYTNGPNMSEYLHEELKTYGLMEKHAPIPRASGKGNIKDGHTNFAHGGAKTRENNNTASGEALSVRNQISDPNRGFAKCAARFRENDLVLIEAGINNFFFADKSDGSDEEKLALDAAADMKDNVSMLVNLGAKNIAIANFIDDSLCPLIESRTRDRLHNFLAKYNDSLNAVFMELSQKHAGVNFIMLDLYGELNRIVKNLSAHGFKYADKTISQSDGSEQDAYIWFVVHPSTKTHRLLANYACRKIAADCKIWDK